MMEARVNRKQLSSLKSKVSRGSGKPGVPIRASGDHILQRARYLAGLRRSVQYGFGLRKTLHLLVEGSLACVEVVEREVAGLVQVSLLVLVLLLLVQRGSLVLLRVRLVDLLRSLLLALIGDLAGLILQ